MNRNLIKIYRVKVALLTFMAILAACGGDPDPAPKTEAEKRTEILTSGDATWAPATTAGVTVDGVDVTDDLFAGFTITFRDGTYTTPGGSPVWPAEDTWRFKDESATIIIRGSDEKEVTITQISATQLTLTLDWPITTTGGRSTSLKGKHVFTLNN